MLTSKTTEIALPHLKLGTYWTLIKDLQTGLLLVTGLAGFASGLTSAPSAAMVAHLLGTLFLTVGGSTVLNMVIDRDVDGRMARTARRPLPSGEVTMLEAIALGLGMVLLGTAWAVALDPLYGAVIFAGVACDVLVYTLWLKRRTPWAILWGGIAGGMPVLAGRVLAVGSVDGIGMWLALAVLLWIPTHIMTFSIKYAGDYRRAGIPVFPNRYGVAATRLVIALSTGGAVVAMLWAMYALGLGAALLWTARVLGGLLFGFTAWAMLRPSPRLNFVLYKLASLYMLGSMLVLIAG